jgi:uncharacterized membrane protein
MLQVTHDSSEVHNETNTSVFIVESLTNSSDGSVTYYLTVYAIFAGLNSIFTLFRAFLFAYGGIHAATSIHKQLLETVIKVSIIFGCKLVKLNLLLPRHQQTQGKAIGINMLCNDIQVNFHKIVSQKVLKIECEVYF